VCCSLLAADLIACAIAGLKSGYLRTLQCSSEADPSLPHASKGDPMARPGLLSPDKWVNHRYLESTAQRESEALDLYWYALQ